MATVLNRVTLELLHSVNTPEYDEVDWIINPDLSALESVPKEYWKIVGDLVLEMDPNEKEAVDNANLSEYKKQKIARIDHCTQQLMSKTGFEYPASSGSFYDLSPETLNRLHGIMHNQDTLDYPHDRINMDGTAHETINDYTEFANFYHAAMQAVQAFNAEGDDLRAQVFNSTSQEEVDAVVDTRC